MNSAVPFAWEKWRSDIARATSLADLRALLMQAGRTLSRSLPRGSVARAQWNDLGIQVLTTSTLESDGACRYREGNSVVLVRSGNNYKRQRFTTAHEIGHLLLANVRDAGRLKLTSEHEEYLCDEFASVALLPPDEVTTYLRSSGGPLSPEIVLELARHFGVNLHPVVIALARNWNDPNRLLIVAEQRGHPRRPDEVDYRVAASAGKPFRYIPRDQRLRTLGLNSLAEWASESSPGKASRGESANVNIPFWSPEGRARTGVIEGEVIWDAITLKRIVVSVLEVDRAIVRWSSGKKQRQPSTTQPGG